MYWRRPAKAPSPRGRAPLPGSFCNRREPHRRGLGRSVYLGRVRLPGAAQSADASIITGGSIAAVQFISENGISATSSRSSIANLACCMNASPDLTAAVRLPGNSGGRESLRGIGRGTVAFEPPPLRDAEIDHELVLWDDGDHPWLIAVRPAPQDSRQLHAPAPEPSKGSTGCRNSELAHATPTEGRLSLRSGLGNAGSLDVQAGPPRPRTPRTERKRPDPPSSALRGRSSTRLVPPDRFTISSGPFRRNRLPALT